MPGVAALVNPIVPDQNEVYVFFNTETGRLALQKMPGAKSGGAPGDTYQASADAQPGLIINPSSLSTCITAGMVVVVGVTKKKPEEGHESETPTKQNISLLSPIYKPIAETNVKNSSVAIVASEEDGDAWAYYLDGADAADTRIIETGFNLGDEETLDTAGITPRTKLAAYVDTERKERYVLYQGGSSNHIYEYNVQTKSPTRISNTGDARSQTAIGVCYQGGYTYLYYVDGDHKVRKIHRDTRGTWGSSDYLDSNGHSITDSSDLTAVPANGVNHVFYVSATKGSNPPKFEHYREKWVA